MLRAMCRQTASRRAALLAWLLAAAACAEPTTRPAATRPADRTTADLLARYLSQKPPSPLPIGIDSSVAIGHPDTTEGVRSQSFAYRATRFGEWAGKTADASPIVAELRRRGPATADACRRALAKGKPKDQPVRRLAALLALTGGREAVPVLIDLLARIGKGPEGDSFTARQTYAAVTWALWEITGRRLQQTSEQWKRWWRAAEPLFVPARERGALRVSPKQVADLAAKLDGSDAALVREQLIVLGPNAVPHLRRALGAADGDRAIHLAWALDELRAARHVPAETRRAYFTRRLLGPGPFTVLGQAAHRRAVADQPFPDFCRTAVAVDCALTVRGEYPRIRTWLHLNSKVFRDAMKGRAAEVDTAVPFLVRCLEDKQKAARATAVKIAATVGFATSAKPKALLRALAQRWPREPDGSLRSDTLFALSRYDTPEAQRVLFDGLWRERVDLLGDCAGTVGWHGRSRLSGRRKAEVDRRLLELVTHADDRVRRGSVRGLAARDPKALAPHLPRLCRDHVRDIRSYCAGVMAGRKDVRDVELLLDLAGDSDTRAARRALQTLQAPAFRGHVPASRLGPALRGESYTTSLAVSLLVREGGAEAGVVLLRGWLDGNPHSAVRRALKRLAGRELRTPEDALAWWWGFPLRPAGGRPARLEPRRLEALWVELGREAGPEALAALAELSRGGEETVAFLAERLAPVRSDDARIAALIAQLDAREYATRAKAFAELARIGQPARAALGRARAGKVPAEARQRAAELLGALNKPYPAIPRARQAARAVRALELVGTDRAVAVLRRLARGAPGAFLTEQAAAALKRLGQGT